MIKSGYCCCSVGTVFHFGVVYCAKARVRGMRADVYILNAYGKTLCYNYEVRLFWVK